jgi:hypothetical protein
MDRAEAIEKMEKILPMVGCSNECEAMAAARRLRFLGKTYGIDLDKVIPSYDTQPASLLRARTRYLWAVADGTLKPKSADPIKPKRPDVKNTGTEWKFDFHSMPGPDYVWIAGHKRRSSKGRVYEVRGFWRLRPGRADASRKAA